MYEALIQHLFYTQHYYHPLIAFRASAERTLYCVAGSTSKRCVQCNVYAEQVSPTVFIKKCECI